MKDRAAGIATVASLVIALLLTIVWVRGVFVRDELVTHVAGRKLMIGSFPHHVYVLGIPEPVGCSPTGFQSGLTQYPSRPVYWELRYQQRPGGTLRIGVPFWLPLSFAVVPPLWWLIQRWERVRRRNSGLCRECGYDIRASRERCPECGTPIFDPAQAPSFPALT